MTGDLLMERALVRERYNRIAPFYDLLEAPMEWAYFQTWREQLWSGFTDETILEVGVGTGKNLAFHPPEASMTGIDLSPRMLARATARAGRMGSRADLLIADAERLPFDDDEFDAAVASFVFCSISNPERALNELSRVVRPGGRVVLLEHVLSQRRWLRWLMQQIAALPRIIWGTSIDRDTVAVVDRSLLVREADEPLWIDVVRLIEARVE